MKPEGSITDFHAHILPGADHGCASRAMCAKQLQLAASYEVGTIVSTSHFYPHMHMAEEFVALRNSAFEDMKDLTSEYGIQVVKGAEVQLCIGLDKMPGIEKLCIEDTNVMLVEIPDMPMCIEMYDTLSRLGRKFDVIVAHTDRYTKDIVDKIIYEGYKMQINVNSLFDIRKRKTIKNIMDTGLVYAIGSDIHGPDKAVYANMKKAAVKLGDEFYIINSRMNKLLGR